VSSNSEMSTISKMKETYWTTKQAVMTKLGKKQDANIVASDAELDAKLEVGFLFRKKLEGVLFTFIQDVAITYESIS